MINPMGIKRLFFALSTLLLSLNANAVLLYEQSPLDGGDAYESFLGSDTVADDFVIGDDVMLTDITWWGFFDPDTNISDFNINIHSDAGGVPSAAPIESYTGQATRTGTGLFEVLGLEVQQFDFALPSPLDLMGGTTYYLSVEFAEFGHPFYWLLSSPIGTQFFQINGSPTWMSDNQAGDLAFALNGTRAVAVPEPSAIVLFAIGLAALGRQKFPLKRVALR